MGCGGEGEGVSRASLPETEVPSRLVPGWYDAEPRRRNLVVVRVRETEPVYDGALKHVCELLVRDRLEGVGEELVA